jgi:hypothetical protein
MSASKDDQSSAVKVADGQERAAEIGAALASKLIWTATATHWEPGVVPRTKIIEAAAEYLNSYLARSGEASDRDATVLSR